MTAESPLADRLADRVNPIALKELRQAVNSRFVNGMLLTLLGLMLAVLTRFALRLDPNGSSTRGDGLWLFIQLEGILALATLVALPLYAGVRLAVERGSESGELLFRTTLTPLQVVWGKLWSALAVAGVTASVCVPFVTVSWLLRGIDIVAIVLTLLVNFGLMLIALSCAMMVGAARCGWFGKAALALTTLLVIFVGWPVATSSCLIGGSFGASSWMASLWFSFALAFLGGTLVPLALAVGQLGPAQNSEAMTRRLGDEAFRRTRAASGPRS